MKLKLITISVICSIFMAMNMSYSQTECELKKKQIVNEEVNNYKSTIPTNIINSIQVTPNSNFRQIFWLHGLNGNSHSWYRAANYSQQNHNILSTRLEYQQESLQNAALTCEQAMISIGDSINNVYNISDPNANYIIGHSQGGLVARMMDYNYYLRGTPTSARRFGGIVTFGTPHSGAKIIDNANNILEYATEGVISLTSGPIAESIEETWYLDVFIDSEDIIEDLTSIAWFIYDLVLPYAVENLSNPSTSDYVPGSPILNNLNSYPCDIPKVAFYGAEEDPVVWRTLSSLLEENINATTFGADDDNSIINSSIYNDILGFEEKYHAFSNLYDDLSNDGCNWWQWIISSELCLSDYILDDIINIDAIIGYSEDEASLIADYYYDGLQWFLNADENYKVLIGNATFESEEQLYCRCIDPDTGEQTTIPINDPNECYNPDKEFVWGCSVIEGFSLTMIEIPTDGVINQESATAFPGVSIEPNKAMLKSNHIQMLNDSNTKTKLTELFNGKHGSYFKK